MSREEGRDSRMDDNSNNKSSINNSSNTFDSVDDRGRGRGRGRGSDDNAISSFSSSSSFDDSRGRGDNSWDDPITGMSSRRQGGSRRGYRFQANADGVVTSLKRIRGNRVKIEKIEAGETWLFDRSAKELIHREFGSLGTEITTYTDNDGDGIFTRAFKTMSPFAASVSNGL